MSRRASWTLVTLAVALAAASMLLATARAARTPAGQKTYLSKPLPLGKGRIWTWITLDRTGKPLALGAALTEAALSGLPEGDAEYPLPLPAQAAATPFKHFLANWNPHGHIPWEIYGLPHFDFHFYVIPPKDRIAMIASQRDLDKAAKQPPAEYVAPDYLQVPDGYWPQMGMHWVDRTTPELHGQKFTYTFLYGFFDGRMIFEEPMITLAFLRSNAAVTRPVKVPAAYPEPGYYPTRYTVGYDPYRRQHTIALEGLTLR